MTNTPSFVGKDDLSKRVANFISSENKRRNLPFNIEIFQPEYVTQCERRIVYRTLGCKTEAQISPPKSDGIKGKWLSMLMKMNDVSVLGVDLLVSDINNNICGTIDLILSFDNTNTKSICMIRGVNSETFDKIKSNGAIRRDVLADMVYMWLAEIPNAIMIYENMENEEFEIFHAIPRNDYIASAKEKYRKLMMFKLQGNIPDRPKRCSDMDTQECKICEFKNTCWKNK